MINDDIYDTAADGHILRVGGAGANSVRAAVAVPNAPANVVAVLKSPVNRPAHRLLSPQPERIG